METKPKKARSPRTKKSPAKAKAPRKPRAPKSLPPPVEISATRPQEPAASQQPESGGLLSGIADLFSNNQPQESKKPSISGQEPKSSSTSEPLTPEAERLLADVPGVIGDVGEGDSDAPVDVAAAGDPIAEMMKDFAFEQEDVRDLAEWLFETLASLFKSEHWKLKDGQADRLAKPGTKVLNTLWLKLQQSLPETISSWLDRTPGAMGLVIAGSLILAPRVTQQIAISRERAKAGPLAMPKNEIKRPVPPGPVPIRRMDNEETPNWQFDEERP